MRGATVGGTFTHFTPNAMRNNTPAARTAITIDYNDQLLTVKVFVGHICVRLVGFFRIFFSKANGCATLTTFGNLQENEKNTSVLPKLCTVLVSRAVNLRQHSELFGLQ